MTQVLSAQEQKAMERIIAQIAQEHGSTESDVRREITGAIMSGMKASEHDPVARELWKRCPCVGEIPTPEEFIFWISRRVADYLK